MLAYIGKDYPGLNNKTEKITQVKLLCKITHGIVPLCWTTFGMIPRGKIPKGKIIKSDYPWYITVVLD